MCFANAVLQLLVHSPLFRDLFRDLGDLKEPHGTGGAEAAGGTTPLVDATVRLFGEFMVEEEPPPPQQSAREKESEDERAKKEHYAVDSFEPTYVYNTMREKKQLENLLVCSHATY
jgi:ubiquitin carboxyl-terminal hydrolase 10